MRYVVGVTGGIASGKTTFLNFLNDSFPIIDTDLITHEVLKLPRIISELTNLLGNQIICNNHIDRSKLGQIVFNDAEKLTQLEAIVHPIIIEEMEKSILRYNGVVLVAVPLLFEKKLEHFFDEIVVVFTDINSQLAWLQKRSNLDKKEALKRIKAQIDLVDKKKLATTLILNTHNLQFLEAQAKKFCADLKAIESSLKV